MAPLEPWEKVLINGETFPETVHGHIDCEDCHGGVQSADKDEAHVGLVARPSEDPEDSCGECHLNVVELAPYSLHNTLQGYWTVLDARSVPADHAQLETMFANHCSDCHASCGDCHVSQPGSVGGGLIDGHMFNRTPSLTRNCTACHGSRIGNEYLGKNEGYQADVHFRQGRMACVDCHSGHEMHGQPDQCQDCHEGPEYPAIAPAEHRYEGVQSPRCETCHVPVALGQDDIVMHQQHANDLSCQVCHSVAYTSCDGCHVAISEKTGNPFYATDDHYMTFMIGKNPRQSYDRPYEWVTLRHIPIAKDSFSFYGDNLLANFDALPTWAYTTPHNIQRNTPQTETCYACHGNADLFLTVDKVAPEELNANLGVIVGYDEIPLSTQIQPPNLEIPLQPTIEPATVITDTAVITNTESTED